jgi:hypothetical protein
MVQFFARRLISLFSSSFFGGHLLASSIFEVSQSYSIEKHIRKLFTEIHLQSPFVPVFPPGTSSRHIAVDLSDSDNIISIDVFFVFAYPRWRRRAYPAPPGRAAWVRSPPTPTHNTSLLYAVGDLK